MNRYVSHCSECHSVIPEDVDRCLRHVSAGVYMVITDEKAPCVSPTGRTDCHGTYIESNGFGGERCKFCKETL